MRLEQAENELILRDARGCSRLFGLLIVVVFGGALYGGTNGVAADPNAPWGISPFVLVLGGIGLAFIIFNFLPFVKITTRVNRTARRVTVERKSPLGKTVAAYEFGRIRRFEVVENSGDEGDYYYEIFLILTDGTRVEPSNSRTSSRDRCDEIARTLNDFIGTKTL